MKTIGNDEVLEVGDWEHVPVGSLFVQFKKKTENEKEFVFGLKYDVNTAFVVTDSDEAVEYVDKIIHKISVNAKETEHAEFYTRHHSDFFTQNQRARKAYTLLRSMQIMLEEVVMHDSGFEIPKP
ncbi:MAG TPA: hypothetical protein PKA60_01190 [Candidatus Paceibacterota bacterium]|nr:hypothetical protein [Candidatus Paceibacterota bacterium]